MKLVVGFLAAFLLITIVMSVLVGTNVVALNYTGLRKKRPKESANTQVQASYVRYKDKKSIRDSKATHRRLNVTAQDSQQKDTERVLEQKVYTEESKPKETIDIVGETVVDKQYRSDKLLDDVFAIRDQDGFDKQWAMNTSNNQASEKVKKAAQGRALLMPEFSQNSQPSRMIGQSNDLAYKLLRPQKTIKLTNPVEWNGSDHHNMHFASK